MLEFQKNMNTKFHERSEQLRVFKIQVDENAEKFLAWASQLDEIQRQQEFDVQLNQDTKEDEVVPTLEESKVSSQALDGKEILDQL